MYRFLSTISIQLGLVGLLACLFKNLYHPWFPQKYCTIYTKGPTANEIIAPLITHDALPVRTGPDVLSFDNTGSFRAIMLIQLPV